MENDVEYEGSSNTNQTLFRFCSDCSSWLDMHPPGSAFYMAIRSQSTFSASQMNELQRAWKRVARHLFGYIRPPVGCCVTQEIQAEWVPDGLEDGIRNKKLGLLLSKWAPHYQILYHKSIGAFLSHCDWNSILESSSQGIPIIGWPLTGRQFFNSHMLEKEAGVCVEIARGGIEEMVAYERMAEAIKVVIEKPERGEKMRKMVSEIKLSMKDPLKRRRWF